MSLFASSPTPGQARDEFHWNALKVILEGTSSFELPGMSVPDRGAAYAFLRHYGLDMELAEDRALLRRIHEEAVSFVQRHFLDGHGGGGRPLPAAVLHPEDPADLLVAASGTPADEVTRWSCSLLRVMHTLHHANRAFRRDSLEEVRRQIFAPYRKVIHVDEHGGPMLMEGETRVPLEGVFFKEEKTRDSIIMKLLHKPNNVAQDIYDWMGLQFVTRTVVEALMVVRFLVLNHLVIFSNVVPGRSVNNLIDLASFRDRFNQLAQTYESQQGPREPWLLEHLTHASKGFAKMVTSTQNPFSATEYRSIQFTCRQLIRVPNPARRPLEVVTRYLQEHGLTAEHAGLLRQLEAIPCDRELTFFFPYEIQILDYENYLKTRNGQSSHAAYKRRQLQAARRRVLVGIS